MDSQLSRVVTCTKTKASEPDWMDPRDGLESIPELSAQDVAVDTNFQFPVTENNRQETAVFKVLGEKWTLDSLLGSGSGGIVFLATYVNTGRRYVVKFLYYCDDPELAFLKDIPYNTFLHDNLCQYYGIVEGVGNLFPKYGRSEVYAMIFMDAIPGGQLFNLLVDRSLDGKPKRMQLSENTMRRFVHDIIRGMAELSMNGISHRDLKPDNLLVDHHGRVVIIDLGHAKKHSSAPLQAQKPSESDTGAFVTPALAVTPGFENSLVSSFSSVTGTDGYHAPECISKDQPVYDSERADVFTVGIIIYMMRHPISAHVVHHDYKGVTDEGLHPELWEYFAEKGLCQFSDDLMYLMNCMLRKNPQRRPRWLDLLGACERSAASLDAWPALKWLAGDLSDPLEFVQEIVTNAPEFKNVLKCSGAIEALITYVRTCGEGEAGAAAAFQKAMKNGTCTKPNSGHDHGQEGTEARLTTNELETAIRRHGIEVNNVDLAALMSKYTSSPGMSLDEFQSMCAAWSFGGRPIVHNCGRHKSRCFAWSPRSACTTLEEACGTFVDELMIAAKSKGYTCERTLDAEKAAEKEDGLRHICFTINWVETELCQLRANVFSIEEKVIWESKVFWGSAVEEMTMLRNLNDVMVPKWGPRVETPHVLTRDWVAKGEFK